MKKIVLPNLALIIITAILVFIIGESSTRIFKMENDVLIELDTCTGFKPIPNKSSFVKNSGGTMPIEVNSYGFRDVEHILEKDPGVFRILFLGDSITEATQVPIEQTFWQKLQKLTDEKQINVEVISFGVASFGTNQELLSYICYGKQYDPDLVILNFFNGNDLVDNYFRDSQFEPQYKLENGSLILDESYRDRIAKRLEQRSTIFPGVLFWIKDHSFFARFLYGKFQNSQVGEKLVGVTKVDGVNPVFLKKYTPKWEEAWAITGALITELSREVRSDGAKLAIMHVPALEQLQPEKIKDPELYDLDKATKRIASIAEKIDVPVIDLYPNLLDAQNTKPINWTTDVHWNEHGHEVVADYLFSELSRLKLIR